MTVPQLNELIVKPGNIQEKIDAMEELAMRNDIDANAVELLKRNASTDTSTLTGAERMNAVDSKRAALLALSLLNGRLGTDVGSARQLPGFNEMKTAFYNPNESPEVKKTILQGLRVLNRPNDPEIMKIAKSARRSSDPKMKQMAEALLQGRAFEFAGM
jgi:hypothetical protein